MPCRQFRPKSMSEVVNRSKGLIAQSVFDEHGRALVNAQASPSPWTRHESGGIYNRKAKDTRMRSVAQLHRYLPI